MRNSMSFLRLIMICAGFMMALPGLAQPNTALQELLRTDGLGNATIGVSVKTLDGRQVLASNANLSLAPASLVKLVATAFALKKRGADYHYTTPVFYTGGEIKGGILNGDVIVDASGDPCLDSDYFPDYPLVKRLAADLEKAGVKRIKGKIRVKGADKMAALPGSWLWEDVSNYYGAYYGAFNYRDNMYVLELRSGAAGSLTGIKSVKPAQPGIVFENQVLSADGNKSDAWIYGGPYSRTMLVKGTIPRNRESLKIKGAMNDPVASFAEELTGILRAKGITVEGGDMGIGTPVKLTEFVSPTVREIVYQTNKHSVNLFAEALGALVSATDYQAEVKALLAGIQVNASGVLLKDACGLSPHDAVPPFVFTDLLIWGNKNLGDDFVRSLPVGGKDAGLNGYVAGFPVLNNRLCAKTGSFSGVRCLSGYLTKRSGQKLAFTIMVNHYTCSTPRLQQAVGRFLAELVNS